MQEKQTVRESGLIVVEHVPDQPQPVAAPPAPDPNGLKCRVCSKPAPADLHPALFGFYAHTSTGVWAINSPVCRHDKWLECRECRAVKAPPLGPGPKYEMTAERKEHFKDRNCPVCGNGCTYT